MVTENFLNKINHLFPPQVTFHLTCERQREDMEKIRTSCSNLSKDVENKFQAYLDKVGDKVGGAVIILVVFIWRFSSDLQRRSAPDSGSTSG